MPAPTPASPAPKLKKCNSSCSLVCDHTKSEIPHDHKKHTHEKNTKWEKKVALTIGRNKDRSPQRIRGGTVQSRSPAGGGTTIATLSPRGYNPPLSDFKNVTPIRQEPNQSPEQDQTETVRYFYHSHFLLQDLIIDDPHVDLEQSQMAFIKTGFVLFISDPKTGSKYSLHIKERAVKNDWDHNLRMAKTRAISRPPVSRLDPSLLDGSLVLSRMAKLKLDDKKAEPRDQEAKRVSSVQPSRYFLERPLSGSEPAPLIVLTPPVSRSVKQTVGAMSTSSAPSISSPPSLATSSAPTLPTLSTQGASSWLGGTYLTGNTSLPASQSYCSIQ